MSTILPIGIYDLLYARRVESARLEFKATWDEKTTGNQILHTICAFANDLQNLNGGYILVGVAEKNGMAQLPPEGLSPHDLDAAQRWIRGKCQCIDPIYQPVLSPEIVDDKNILVIWAPASDVRPHQCYETITEKGSSRHYYIRLGNESLQAKGELLTQLLQLTAKVPFDDRRANEVPLEKIKETRVREFLSDIHSGLLEEKEAKEIYRRMYISSPVNSHEVPRNVGLLFFSDDPEMWFRGARIEVVQFAADSSGDVIEEKIFRGPLHHQLLDCINYLRSFSLQHFEKQSDRPETKGWVSYPLPALEESLVNAVYHRSYENNPEPVKVYLYHDRIEIISYPGPVPGIELRHLQPDERIPPVPARNRRIGEFLKELRLAEGRGTGIKKVYRTMIQNESPPPRFDFDESRTFFQVVLPAHPEYVAISALRDVAHLRAIGNQAAALNRLHQAFSEQPASETIASSLIADLAKEGCIDEARHVYQSFLASPIPKSSVRVVIAMSNALLDAKQETEARKVLDQLPAMLSAKEAFEAAIVERRAGRQERAHQYFEKAADAVYHDVRALHEFAQTKMKLSGKLARRSRKLSRYEKDAQQRLLREAKEMLQRVIQMDAPSTRHAWAWFDLGKVLRWQKAPASEVRNAIEQAHRLAPEEKLFASELERLS